MAKSEATGGAGEGTSCVVPDGRTNRADRGRGRVQGLEIRTTGGGEVVYRFRFRLNGRSVNHTFKAGSLAEARRTVEAWRVALDHGVDPRRKPKARALTLGRAAALWLRSRDTRSWKPSTRVELRGLVARHVLPGLRTREVNSLTRAEVWARLRALSDDHPVTSNRVFATWRMLFGWLGRVDQEHLGVTADPLRGLQRPGGEERPRDVTLTDAQLRALLSDPATPDYVRLVAYTGVRDSEARLLTWSEIDWARGVWTIPGSRTKNGRAHLVPLSSGALALLRGLRTRFLERPWVRTRPQKGLRKAGIRPHDVRRTVSDRIKQQYGEATMHAVLGHAEARLTQTYGPSPRLRELADALEWWAQELARLAA